MLTFHLHLIMLNSMIQASLAHQVKYRLISDINNKYYDSFNSKISIITLIIIKLFGSLQVNMHNEKTSPISKSFIL